MTEVRTRSALRVAVAAAFALLAALLAGTGTPAGAAPAPADGGERYYVSLGDSLAVGVQPGPDGDGVVSGQGFADQLYALRRLADPQLELVQLGCPGETTESLRSGGTPAAQRCFPNGEAQLEQAAAFLAEHRGSVALVTISVGGNDLARCVSGTAVDEACVDEGFAAAARNLPVIAGTLREAAGEQTPIVGITYYNPYLAAWLQGPEGQEVARATAAVLAEYNLLLRTAYATGDVAVADVERSYLSGVFSPEVDVPPHGPVPLNVAVVCSLTFMCAPPPVGPDVHPTTAGYSVIAATVAAALPQHAGAGAR